MLRNRAARPRIGAARMGSGWCRWRSPDPTTRRSLTAAQSIAGDPIPRRSTQRDDGQRPRSSGSSTLPRARRRLCDAHRARRPARTAAARLSVARRGERLGVGLGALPARSNLAERASRRVRRRRRRGSDNLGQRRRDGQREDEAVHHQRDRRGDGLNADQVDGKSAADIAAGVSVGEVRVEADGRLVAGNNRRGGTPTTSRTGTGAYTVTFPGFTASGDALPQVTIIGAQFGLVRRRQTALCQCSPRMRPSTRGSRLRADLFDTPPDTRCERRGTRAYRHALQGPCDEPAQSTTGGSSHRPRTALDAAEAAAPVDAVDAVAASSDMVGADCVGFLIADFGGDALIRLGATSSGAAYAASGKTPRTGTTSPTRPKVGAGPTGRQGHHDPTAPRSTPR